MRNKALTLAFLLAVFFCLSLQADDRLELKLRVYEGTRQGVVEPPELVTTSYIQPTITANLRTDFELEKEKAQIKRVFNLQDVAVLTEADLAIGEERAGQSPYSARHFFRLNGNEFSAVVMLQEWKAAGRFLVLFNEIVADKPKNILTTEMLLLGGHSAVFGFEGRNGKPYFCSFYITGPPDKIIPPPPPPPPAPPLPPELKEKIVEFEKGAVKAKDAVNPPRLIKKVDPIFPEEAKKSILKGVVVVNVRTDAQGNVKQVMVIRSTDKVFNEPAINAVKQWKYEPYVQDGQPKEVVFSVSVRFETK